MSISSDTGFTNKEAIERNDNKQIKTSCRSIIVSIISALYENVNLFFSIILYPVCVRNYICFLFFTLTLYYVVPEGRKGDDTTNNNKMYTMYTDDNLTCRY